MILASKRGTFFASQIRYFAFSMASLIVGISSGWAQSETKETKPKPTKIPLEMVERLEAHLGLEYARYGDRSLELDLYRPRSRQGKLPAIVCIHGGGWFKGARGNMTQLAQALADRGFVAVTISYRLSGEAKFPAAIQDCKAAVRWLRSNADRFEINQSAIGVTGLSAGGHLAALLATTGGVEALEGDGGNAQESSRVQACVAMGAQTDFKNERITALSRQPEDPFFRPFLGGNAITIPEVYQLASPRHHADASDPPIAFITGELDHESTHADAMRSDLAKWGIDGGLTVIPKAPHAFLGQQEAFDKCVESLVTFFEKHLR